MQKIARIMADLKLPHELVRADLMKSRYPCLNYGSDFLCLVDPTAGLLYADRCVKALQVWGNSRERGYKKVLRMNFASMEGHFSTDTLLLAFHQE